MAKGEKRWVVNIIMAETWDGKTGAPNLIVDNQTFCSLGEARMFIQNETGKICSNSRNRLEWISWTSRQLTIKYSCDSESVSGLRKTRSMDILEIADAPSSRWVEIGG